MFKKNDKQVEHSDDYSLMCRANGCPMLSTNKIEGSGWVCVHHAFVMVDLWGGITEGLRENSWLKDFISDMVKMDKKREQWREFANRFWENDPPGKPDPKEPAANYINRMKSELSWRCGAMAKRPQPRIPQVPKKKGFGNMAGYTEIEK